MKFISINFKNTDKIIFLSLLFISLFLFLFYVNLNAHVNFYGENSWIEKSQKILDGGLFQFQEELRTYLYFTIIAGLRIIANDDLVIAKIFMSVLQYVVYLISVIFIANFASLIPKSEPKSTSPNFIVPEKANNKTIWLSVIAFGFLNPFLIQATTLFAPSILASCFVVLSIFSLTRIDLNRLIFVIIPISLFYSSVMLRPSSWIFLPIVLGLIIFRFLKKKNINLLKILFISLALLVIFTPQLYLNVSKYDKWTLLPNTEIYEWQVTGAAKHIKYGTVVIPGENPSLRYYSPIEVEKNATIYQLLFEEPSTFLFLYFSHIFGVFDWDYVDTFIKEFYPLNRIPASLLIYSTWFFVICGIFSAGRNFFTSNRLLLTTLIISTMLYIAFIATTSVEVRFGYPIFLLLLPFSGYGIKFLFDSIIHNKKTSKLWIKRIGFITVYSLFISTFFYISFLFSYQTYRIDWFEFFKMNLF